MNPYAFRIGHYDSESGWLYFTATEKNGMIDALQKIKYNVVSRSKINPAIEYKADPYYHYTFKCSAVLTPDEYSDLRRAVLASTINEMKLEYYMNDTTSMTFTDVNFTNFPEVKNDGRFYKQLYKFTLETIVE